MVRTTILRSPAMLIAISPKCHLPTVIIIIFQYVIRLSHPRDAVKTNRPYSAAQKSFYCCCC